MQFHWQTFKSAAAIDFWDDDEFADMLKFLGLPNSSEGLLQIEWIDTEEHRGEYEAALAMTDNYQEHDDNTADGILEGHPVFFQNDWGYGTITRRKVS